MQDTLIFVRVSDVTDLLTTAEVAERLRVSVATVNKYARDNLLPAIVLPGGTRRYRLSDIDALLNESGPTEAAS